MDSGQRNLLKQIMKNLNLGSFDFDKNKSYQAGLDFNRQMLDPNSQAYQNLEAPYRRQYQEETVPRIAEAFSAYDAQDSSAFRQSLGRSAEDLEMNIAGQKQSAMSNAAQSMLQYSQAPGNIYQSLINTALGSQSYGYQQVPGTQGFFVRSRSLVSIDLITPFWSFFCSLVYRSTFFSFSACPLIPPIGITYL